jgi:hypothetical protein
MAKRTKRSMEEKLTDSNLEKVISLLEAEKPITKKAACEILNIAYNTTRLTKILEEYKEKKARDAQLRSEKRGKPVTSDEAAYMIQAYLEGDPIDSISKSTHRGPTLIKHVLEKYGCPIRARSPDYFHPELIPEECMRISFKEGDTVYSARYDSIAKIRAEYKPGIYRVWLCAENQKQHAYQPTEELAALDHLIALGVRV